MAILSSGKIITQGNPIGLVETLKGKIWSKIIKKEELNTYKTAFDVISNKLVAGKTQIRVIAEARPEAGFEVISANLEDFYFATLFNHQPTQTV